MMVVLLATSGLAVSAWYGVPFKPWRTLAALVAENSEPQDGLVLWNDPMKPLSYQVNQLGLAEEMPVLAFPPRPWSHNPYKRGQPGSGGLDDLLACRFERVWLVAGRGRLEDPETGRLADVYVTLTEAYDEVRDIRHDGFHVQLMVRNADPCPAP
jgi:hypothetical protein